jgi:chemotaxis protein histidine kinase CheA
MGRFALSHRGGCFTSPSESWYDDDSSTFSESDKSFDSKTSDEDDYPHPLGFSSLGKTRFFLDPPKESVQQLKRRLGFTHERDDVLDNHHYWEDSGQSFPPLSSYTDARTVPMQALLEYSEYDEERPDQEDSLENLTQRLRNGFSMVECPKALKLMSESQLAGQQMWALCKNSERERQSIQHRMDLETQRVEKENAETADAFRLLLKRDEQAATKVEEERRAQEEAEELQRDEERKDDEERQREADERQRQQQEKEQKVSDAEEKRKEAIRSQKKQAAEEKAKKSEYVVKAQKLVAKLVDLRASVAPFEKSKNVLRRRINMKKTVKGKVNTLSLDAHKIQSVANDVTNAVQQAREEDEQLKQQAQAGNSQITPEMTRGKRYLVDLLASDAMARAQSEGFNG